MKPVYIGLLVFAAVVTIGIGLFLVVTKAPAPPAPVTVVSPAELPVTQPAPSPAPKRDTEARPARRTAESARKTVDRRGTQRGGGIFSGADPRDPRIQHLN